MFFKGELKNTTVKQTRGRSEGGRGGGRVHKEALRSEKHKCVFVSWELKISEEATFVVKSMQTTWLAEDNIVTAELCNIADQELTSPSVILSLLY